jgi:hypothetical protein
MSTSVSSWWRDLGFEDGPADIALIGPLLLSLFMLLVASAGVHVPVGLLLAALAAQAAVLAISAASATAAACANAAQWAGRVAPSRAGQRARARMWRQLRLTGALGVTGPLVLAAAWQSPRLTAPALPGAAVAASLCLLLAAQLLGGWCGMAWRGRAPRAVLFGWPLLGLALYGLGPVWRGLMTWPVGSVLVIAGVAWGWQQLVRQWLRPCLLWAGVRRHRTVPEVELAQRRRQQGWHWLPFRDQIKPDLGNDSALPEALRRLLRAPRPLVMFMVLPQAITQHTLWTNQAWGLAVHGAGVWAYSAWLAGLNVIVANCLLHPGLHWRRLLAPGGFSKRGWAWRMLGRSLLAALVVLTTLVAAVWWSSPAAELPLQLATWPTVAGDICLAGSFAMWMRGLRNELLWVLACSLALGLAALITTAGLAALGWPLVRGGTWLGVQLLLSLLMCGAAVRVWAGRDLNELTTSG